MMKLHTLLLPLLLALCAAHAADLTALLPEDTTIAGLGTDMQVLDKLAGHPVVKAFATPELKKLFAPWREQNAADKERSERIWKEETGMTPEQALGLFTGGFANGFTIDFARIMDAMGKPKGAGLETLSPFQFMDVTMLMNFGGTEEMAGKIAKAYGRSITMAAADRKGEEKTDGKSVRFPDDFDATTEEYGGATLHLWKPRRGEKSPVEAAGWVLLDKVLVFALSERALHKCVDCAAKGGKSLADSARFRDVVAHTKDSDAAFYIDLHTVTGTLLETLGAKSKPALLPFDPVAALKAIGADKFDAMYFVLDFTDSTVDAEFGLTFQQKPALLDLLAIDGPGSPPDFIPADADSGSYGTFHFGRLLPAVEKLLTAAMPIVGQMMNSQLDAMKKRSGVDLQKDLLSNVGPNAWDASAASGARLSKEKKDGEEDEDEDSQVIGLQLKDRKAFDLALDSVINMAVPGKALFEVREYQGFTIKSLKESPTPMAFLTTDEWLIVSTGPQSLLDRVLSRMKNGATGGLFAQPHVRDAIAGLPDGGHGTAYMDLGALLNQLLPLLRELDEVPGVEKFVDLGEVPDKLRIPLILASRQFMDERSVRVRVRISEKAK